MKKTFPPLSVVFLILAVGSLPSSSTFGAPSEVKSASNEPQNVDFEDWSFETLEGKELATAAAPDGVPSHWFPFVTEDSPDTRIRKDSSVSHGGGTSVKLTSESTDSTVGIYQFVTVEPNTRYTVRLWIKGEDIHIGKGPGVIIWANCGPEGDIFFSQQNYNHDSPSPADGTFDWRLFEFNVDTKPNSAIMKIALQLRWASGAAWFDNLELIKGETVSSPKDF